jgi:hypothetical protein
VSFADNHFGFNAAATKIIPEGVRSNTPSSSIK